MGGAQNIGFFDDIKCLGSQKKHTPSYCRYRRQIGIYVEWQYVLFLVVEFLERWLFCLKNQRGSYKRRYH